MHSIHKNLNRQSRMDSSVLNYLSTTTIGIVIPLLVIISCLLLFHPSKVGNVREPPMVGGAWPVIGHLPLLSKSKTPHKTLAAIADKYGPLFTIKLGAKQVLVLSNWEMAKECFTKNDKLVSTRPKLVSIENLSYNKAMFGLAPYGPYWRELRKIVTLELLCNRRIELLRHVRVSEVEASIKGLFNLWSSRKNELGYVLVEMKHWFAQLTFNVVLRMIVGKRFFGVMDLENEENGERIVKIMRDFLRMFGVFPVADAVPSLRWLDLGGHEKVMKEIAKELDEIMCEWLDEHRQNRGLNQKDDASDQDFMDVMLSVLNDAKIDQFDADTIIKATALSMILGGTDTTSVTLTWTMSLLMRNPDVLKKAKEELDSQIGKERCVSETDINNLVYLQAIVKETLRLYPAAPLVGIREFTEDCILGGYHVKKGTRLMTNLWKIHTDPSIWSDPLEFKPERFLSTHKDVDFRGQHFEFVPFGSGRRMCPGVSFGLQIVHFTLARFLHCFDILNPSSEPVDMTETLGLTNEKATPLEILVKPCLSPSCCYETM